MKISEKLKTGLTNAEKIECYKKCITHFENGGIFGICDALDQQFLDSNEYYNYQPIYKLFPELLKKRPNDLDVDDYWFKSNLKRIQVLNELIAELS